MPQELGWSVEAKLLYQIKQLTKALSSRSYIQTYANFASFPNPGITGTLYVDEATGDIYVWNGASYVLLSSGITALNGLIAAAQLLVTGSSGTDFNIVSSGTTHTFNIPTASATNRGLLSSADWSVFNNKQDALLFGNIATATSGITIINGAGSTVGPNVGINIATASALQNGLLSSIDWSVFNAKQDAVSLTTTGNSGAATFIGAVLNIPNYTLSGLGGVPSSRTLTINGTTFDLSADRSWSVGTVTNVSALTIGTTGTDVSSTVATGTTTPVITLNIPTASATNRGALSSADWTTFNNKQNALTLTTTGTSGPATLVGSTVNIPQYQTALTNPVTGTGTTNYIAKFTGTSTIGNSLIFDNGTSVGIGTASPNAAYILDLTSSNDGRARQWVASSSFVGDNGDGTGFQLRTLGIGNGGIRIANYSNNTEWARFNSAGELLIGTTTDVGDYKLQVAGAIYSSNGFYMFKPASTIGRFEILNGAVGFRAQADSGNAQAAIGTSTNHPFLILTNDIERMRIFANGNVRIGSTFTDSGYLFQVAGTSVFTDTITAQGSSSVALQISNNTAIRSSGTIYLDFAFPSGSGNLDIRGGSSLNTVLYLTTAENVGIGNNTFGTSATKTLSIRTGATSPTSSPADCFQLYSADITAGNAAPHFRTENGAVVKVYQETTAVAAATLVSNAGTAITATDTFDGYTLQQIVKALRNQGLLA